MFTHITLKEFLSFSDLSLDLRDPTNGFKRLAVVYGENGSGKTNLVTAFAFLKRSIETMIYLEVIEQMHEDEKYLLDMAELRRLSEARSLSKLIAEHRTIGSKKTMELSYSFVIDGKRGVYSLTADGSGLRSERLLFQLGERIVSLFEFDDETAHIHKTLFYDAKFASDLMNRYVRYRGKHSFMSMVVAETVRLAPEYVHKTFQSSFLNIVDSFTSMSVSCRTATTFSVDELSTSKILHQLPAGTVSVNELPLLHAYEAALNDFFMPLYTDVKKVIYVLQTKDGKVDYELHFQKMINGELLDVPFQMESTGTMRLLDIFPYVYEALRGSAVIIDEFDTGVHDLLVSTLMRNLIPSIKGQLIVTTHNTTLMESLRDSLKSLYVIELDAYGCKRILSLDKLNYRVQRNHNPRDLYLRGLVGGAPFTADIDFNAIVAETTHIYGSES